MELLFRIFPNADLNLNISTMSFAEKVWGIKVPGYQQSRPATPAKRPMESENHQKRAAAARRVAYSQKAGQEAGKQPSKE